MKKAFVHLADGFEEIEAITIIDVLRRAEIPTLSISISDELDVTGAHGISIKADLIFTQANYAECEIIILPGGMPGSKNLDDHKGLKEKLTEFSAAGNKIAAICAAPMVLGGLDILKGRDAVCYPGFEESLTCASIKYDASCVSDNITTGRGPGAALEFSLSLVEQLKGKALADKLAREMLVQNW